MDAYEDDFEDDDERDATLGVSTEARYGDTMRLDSTFSGALGATIGPAVTPAAVQQATVKGGHGLAWDAGGEARPPEAARGGSGGIAFDVTLEAPRGGGGGGGGALGATRKSASVAGRPKPFDAAAAAAPRPPPTAPSEPQTQTLTVPAQLFGQGTPLSSKVHKLRAHLVEQLGGQVNFDRVYEYVSREESGAGQSGEREAILTFMADHGQRELLPLVHTLIYLEEALGT